MSRGEQKKMEKNKIVVTRVYRKYLLQCKRGIFSVKGPFQIGEGGMRRTSSPDTDGGGGCSLQKHTSCVLEDSAGQSPQHFLVLTGVQQEQMIFHCCHFVASCIFAASDFACTTFFVPKRYNWQVRQELWPNLQFVWNIFFLIFLASKWEGMGWYST